MNIQKDDRWSVLKGALLISVVVGHFCQLYLDRELRGGGYNTISALPDL